MSLPLLISQSTCNKQSLRIAASHYLENNFLDIVFRAAHNVKRIVLLLVYVPEIFRLACECNFSLKIMLVVLQTKNCDRE